MEDSKNKETSQDITEYENLSIIPPEHRSSPSSPDRGDVAMEASIGASSGVEPEENDAEQGDDAGEEPDEKDVGQDDDDGGSGTGSYSLSPSQLQTDVRYSVWPAPQSPMGKDKEGAWNSSASEHFGEPSVLDLSGQHLPMLTMTR